MKETAVFMNMCRVIDPQGRWLMQERNDEDYPGWIFPGGHLDPDESLSMSVIREVQEETGLTIKNPKMVGVKHWSDDGIRYTIFLYDATEYKGELISSDEGRVFWATPEEVKNAPVVADFWENMPLYENENLSELCYLWDEEKHDWNAVYS